MLRIGRALLLLVMAIPAGGYPVPASLSPTWELNIKFQDIRRIKISLPGEPTRTYWYMIYTVTNTSERDVMFNPELTLVTDDLDVYRAQFDVPPEMFDAIKEQYKNTYPWLEHPRDMIGKVRPGKDNARDSVAIWPDFSPRTSQFDVYVSGLSGEVAAVPNPLYVAGGADPNKGPKEFVLRKTLQIKYTLPGDAASRERVMPIRSGQPAMDWVMR